MNDLKESMWGLIGFKISFGNPFSPPHLKVL